MTSHDKREKVLGFVRETDTMSEPPAKRRHSSDEHTAAGAEMGKVGFANAGHSCYLNAAFQLLLQMSDLFNGDFSKPGNVQFLYQLFSLRKNFGKPYVVPHAHVTAWVETNLPAHLRYRGEQGDAHEVLIALLDVIEQNGGRDRVRNIVNGTQRNTTTCSSCRVASTRDEFFTQLTVPFVGDGAVRIESFFADMFRPEVLDGDNMYQCDTCNSRQLATRTVEIARFPQYLLIQVLRFDSDRKIFNPFVFAHRVAGSKRGDPVFQLQGFIVHEGESKNRGHYVTYGTVHMDMKHPRNSKWMSYNDSRCTEVNLEILGSESVQKNIYVLLFKRTGTVV